MTPFQKSTKDLMKETGLGIDFCTNLLNIFIKNADSLIKSIKINIAEKEIKKAEFSLHQLKGSSGNVRAADIFNIVIIAEAALKNGDLAQAGTSVEIISQLISGFYG